MPKRKADSLEGASKEPRRSSRTKPSLIKEEDTIVEKTAHPEKVVEKEAKKATKSSKQAAAAASSADSKKTSKTNSSKPTPPKAAKDESSRDNPPTGRQYWLMKAEPESRLENGTDVKFSIDDLAAKKEPEPWDGIRAYPARNNLRAMKKGDLAFFYHSNCKVPGIVGVMEIVQEHSPDLSAHNPSAPYYDPSSKPEDPKWSVVHVTFRQKLNTPITLKDLRELQAQKDSPLANMQMLKLSRLSVSKVSAEEWEFLTGLMEKNGDKILY
ncbi:PUA-like domain-containing protein [Xylogone sp. PMI_703]|nr:PUA-like domain-containing protein [Xylogone sp. PMI_703]